MLQELAVPNTKSAGCKLEAVITTCSSSYFSMYHANGTTNFEWGEFQTTYVMCL
jgi:hypothetical protein